MFEESLVLKYTKIYLNALKKFKDAPTKRNAMHLRVYTKIIKVVPEDQLIDIALKYNLVEMLIE